MKSKILVSWSSGKDSAWMLHTLNQRDDVEVVGLLTSVNEAVDRVAMHAVRRELVEAQAQAAGLPLTVVPLPWPCTNALYEARMMSAIQGAKAAGITHIAFGDLFLEDIRQYRVDMLAGSGVAPLFPIWGTRADTPALAQTMLSVGIRAKVTCVDTRSLPADYLGQTYDPLFVNSLPDGVDHCAENGEFHTFCYAGPMFSEEIQVKKGVKHIDEPFHFMDFGLH